MFKAASCFSLSSRRPRLRPLPEKVECLLGLDLDGQCPCAMALLRSLPFSFPLPLGACTSHTLTWLSRSSSSVASFMS